MYSQFLSLCALAAVAPYLLASPVPVNSASSQNVAVCEQSSTLVQSSLPLVEIDAAESSENSIVSHCLGIDGLPGKIISFAGRPLDCSTVSKSWRNEAMFVSKRKVVLRCEFEALAFMATLKKSVKLASKQGSGWQRLSDSITTLVLGNVYLSKQNDRMSCYIMINVDLVLDMLRLLTKLKVLSIVDPGPSLISIL
jgi:hypothetical protein